MDPNINTKKENTRQIMNRGNLMKTKQKAAGFFIVEVLIVLVLLAILTLLFLPNLQTYTNRAKFADVVRAAAAAKPAVEACAVDNNGTLTSCDTAAEGIPTYGFAAGSNVASVAVANGVITATAGTALNSETYILTPTYDSGSKTMSWASSGSCSAGGLC